jgi:multidrug resistance efflux pump
LGVDLAPLINIRKDYFLAKSQQQSAHIKLQHSQKNVQRLRALQRDQAVSTRKLHEQQVQLQINQTLFNTAQQQANNIQLYAQLQKS